MIKNFIQQQFHIQPSECIAAPDTTSKAIPVIVPAKLWAFQICCDRITADYIQQQKDTHNDAGYQVIWALQANYFFKRRLSDIEKCLFYQPYFFVTDEFLCFTNHSPVYYNQRSDMKQCSPLCLQTAELSCFLRPASQRPSFRPSFWQELYYRWLFKQTSP